MAYADISYVEARWRNLTAEETSRVEALLDEAAVIIDAELPSRVVSTQTRQAAKIVSARMVQRAIEQGNTAGAQSVTEQTGPFSTTLNYGAGGSSGSLYLTKADRKLLGIGRQVAFTVSMAGEPGGDC